MTINKTQKQIENEIYNKALLEVLSILDRFILKNKDSWNPIIVLQVSAYKNLIPCIEHLIK